MVGIKKKLERRDRARETKALSAATLERSIEAELLSRLKSKAYGDAPLNVNEDVWRQVLERERLGDEEDMEELEDEDSGEEDEDMDEDEMEEEMEGGEREFVEDDSDFDEDDEEDDMEDYSGEEVRRLSFNVPSAFQRYVSLADTPVGCGGLYSTARTKALPHQKTSSQHHRPTTPRASGKLLLLRARQCLRQRRPRRAGPDREWRLSTSRRRSR
jgi:hypothetical protein